MANDDGYLNSIANDGNEQQTTSHHQAKFKSRSPLNLRQASPFPNELTNRRMQQAQFNTTQERHRNGKNKIESLIFQFKKRMNKV